ncbi:MAG: histidine kinase [Acidimicrobiales bacterium]
MIPYRLIDSAERLKDVLDSVFLLASDLAPDALFGNVVASATRLVDARCGALVLLDPATSGASKVVHVGLDSDAVADLGRRPELPALLDVMVKERRALRLDSWNGDPGQLGLAGPAGSVTSFLGLPILLGSRLFALLYLVDKASRQPSPGVGDEASPPSPPGKPACFDDQDEAVVATLAFAAGLAFEINRLESQVRELTLISDRERIAMELHDKVIGRLFSLGLSLQGAARTAAGPLAAKLHGAVNELDTTIRDIRDTVFSLGPPGSPQPGAAAVEGMTPEVER